MKSPAEMVFFLINPNLETAPIEDVINEHLAVAESPIVGFSFEIK